MSNGMPALPEQSGWGVEMHGYMVAFCSNAEKAIGHSPGADAPLFTAEQMRAYGRSCIEESVTQMLKWYPQSATASMAAADIREHFNATESK